MRGKVFGCDSHSTEKILRMDGERISFEDNAVAILKDEKGIQKELRLKDL